MLVAPSPVAGSVEISPGCATLNLTRIGVPVLFGCIVTGDAVKGPLSTDMNTVGEPPKLSVAVAVAVIAWLKSVRPTGPTTAFPPGVHPVVFESGVNEGSVSGPVQFATCHVLTDTLPTSI